MLETLPLNPEQKKAASALKGYNLVIASAGTGKTSTIVGRILYLLDNGIKPKKSFLWTSPLPPTPTRPCHRPRRLEAAVSAAHF
ncbi:UvrD-helicase domain-containing protein, partial [Helicobacter pylori]|uniref:UvrD-helicase domain-containing protein n=1 Tax=Helicobacter pylori TaxID=210 RepID=UPI0036F34A9F